jgi:hypothetical protein
MSRAGKSFLAGAALLLLAASAASARAEFGTNLIVNGDAEGATAAGQSTKGSGSGYNVIRPIPGWMPTGNFTVVQYGAPDFPTATGPGPANRGKNFFAGGPDNPASSATQVIDLSADANALAAGGVTFTLSGWFGGWLGQNDNAVLTVTFRNANNVMLGTASVGGVTNKDRDNKTGLLERSTKGAVPKETRNLLLTLQMTRFEGAYNDGYADNLSLVLSGAAKGVRLVDQLFPPGLVMAQRWDEAR